LFWADYQLVGTVVNEKVVGLDVGVTGGNIFKLTFEHSFREFHDVGFGGNGHLGPVF